MTLAYFLLSCFHGIRECFIPFSPRKSIAWLSTILLMIVRNAFQYKRISFMHLTVTVRAGSRLPKPSKMLITAKMSTVAQK